jgi:hypothetical protein
MALYHLTDKNNRDTWSEREELIDDLKDIKRSADAKARRLIAKNKFLHEN